MRRSRSIHGGEAMRPQGDVVSLSKELAVAHRLSLVIGLASVVCLALLHTGSRASAQLSEHSRPTVPSKGASIKNFVPLWPSAPLAGHMLAIAMPELGLSDLFGNGSNGPSSNAAEPADTGTPSGVVTGHVKYDGT